MATRFAEQRHGADAVTRAAHARRSATILVVTSLQRAEGMVYLFHNRNL